MKKFLSLVLVIFLGVVMYGCGGKGGGGGEVTTGTIKGKVILPSGTNAKFAQINDLTKLIVQVGTVTTNPDANGNYQVTISPGTNIEITVLAPSGNVLLKAIVPELKKGETVTQNINTLTTAVALIYKANPSLTIEQINLATDVLSTVETAIKNALTDTTEDSIIENADVKNAIDRFLNTIKDNQPPAISSLTANPTSINTGKTSTITCTATDPDGDDLTYNWETTGGTITGSGSSVTFTSDTAGTYTITCTVSDGKGGITKKSVNITVVGVTLTNISITSPSTTLKVGQTTQFTATGTYSDGSTKDITSSVTWASSNTTVGTISSSGLFTAKAQGTTDITATKDGKTSAPVTIRVVSSSSECIEYINNARSALFKCTVYASDFEYAKQQINLALNCEPNNPDANLISAVIDIIGEAERIKSNVIYLEPGEPNTIFPLGGYTLKKALMPPAEIVLSPLTEAKRYSKVKKREPILKQRKGRLSKNPKPSEIQQEVETNVIPVLNGIVTKLEKVLNYVNSNPNWKFPYPKDTCYPELESYYIDKGDVEAIVSIMYLIRGLAHYGCAYHLDVPDGWKSSGDVNNDGLFNPAEYLPPLPFGTTRTGGTTHLSNAKEDFKKGTELLKKAVDSAISKQNVGYYTLTSHFRHLFLEICTR
jgi:hypothetical protein